MQRTAEHAKAGRWGGINVTRQDVSDWIFWLLGFFVGRVIIFNTLNPVAIAYTSPYLSKGKKFYISIFFVALGLATKFNPYYSIKYFMSMALLVVINILITGRMNRDNYIIKGIVVSVCVAGCGIVAAVANGFGLYFIIMSLLEGVLTFSFSLIMGKGVNALSGKTEQGRLNNEELISLLILCGAIVAGAADIYIGSLSLKYFFCSLLVLLMAQSGGTTLGATGGLLVGLLMNLSGYETVEYIAILGVCGLLSGSMKDMGKIFSIIGFIVGNALAVFYFGISYFTFELMLSVLLAGTVFFAIPDKLALSVYSAINPAYNSASKYAEKVRTMARSRLDGFSNALGKLAKTFGGLSEKKERFTQKDVNRLIDDVAAKICADCRKSDICWGESFYETYQMIFGILNVCEKKGTVELSDIPVEFQDVCITPQVFYETISQYFELYKSDLGWYNKIIESRELVSQQLFGVSNIVSTLSEDLELDLNFDAEMETRIIDELSILKIEVENVIVLQNKQGRYEVTITQKSGMFRDYYIKNLVQVASRVLGRIMKVSDDDFFTERNGVKQRVHISLTEQQRLCVTSGLAKSAKTGGNESGDSYSFMELKNGKCLMALSDGMGSGKRARQQSAAAIDLLEEFIESGFDRETAVTLINSALLLKSNDESFSTLDICSVDLHTGLAEFVKIGAASTFLIRKNEVEIIRSWSLPVGILNAVDVDVSHKRLRHGDIVVMMTDGVLDSDEIDESKENWVVRMIKAHGASNPQDIADYLLEQAKQNYGTVVKDDMTVLVSRIWER